jgi:Domain of unknown function (DUF5011)
MKNIKKIYFLVLSLATLVSCSYEPEIGSKETSFPIVTINGETVFVTTKGTPYTDQGATAKEGTATIPVTTTGADKVDTNTIGVYKITYAAVNKDGFDASAIRTVIVTDNKPSTIDLTGNWFRGANKNVITRISDRKYVCDNATGYINGDPNNLTMTFYNLDDVKVYAPYQENCSLTGIDAESRIGTITSPTRFNWIIDASGFFGTAVRSFVKS